MLLRFGVSHSRDALDRIDDRLEMEAQFLRVGGALLRQNIFVG